MPMRTLPAAALTLICLVLGGCREHNEPAKPIAGPASSSTSVAPQAR